MKMRKVLPIVLIAAALTGCAKQVIYADFHKKASEAETDNYVSAVARVKGSRRFEGMSISMDKTIEFKKNSPLSSLAIGWVPTDAELGAEYVFVTDLMNENARQVKETSGYVYYIDNSTYAIKDAERGGMTKYDKYGCFISYAEKGDTNDYTVTVKYSK